MATAVELSVVELKRCPRCEESLPVSEFGVCRARKDGRNLYCKRCIRQKIAQSRQALREYKKARSQHGANALADQSRSAIGGQPGLSAAQIARILRKLSPAERVREAIRCGARTQKEIAQVTKLPKDEIGDALANLLLWTREIRTDVVNNTRVYFVSEAVDELANPGAEKRRKIAGRRHPELNPSFSSVHDLMPGRKPYAGGKKRGTGRAHPSGKTKGKGEQAA